MIREIQRLRAKGLSKRMIAKALGCSRNTVDKYLSEQNASADETKKRPFSACWAEGVAWHEISGDVNRGTPLSEVWERRCGSGEPLSGVPYVSFWREYRRRYPNVPLEMHKLHPPGERCEIDYKGDAPGLGYIDRTTGQFMQCRLYGAILPFSQLFFPKATLTERQPDLFSATASAYEYFGGVPLTSAVDNAKTCVTRAHRYDPDINKEFSHFCEHYGTAPLAMRPGKPKDKNLIECTLGVFWRWARRRIRDRQVFSLGELNDFLVELVDEFNNRTQRKYGISRREKFEQGEQPKLLPLPGKAYQFGEWKSAKLHPDCHIQLGYNFYSAPYGLRGKSLEVRVSASLVEVFHNLERVACHLRVGDNSRGRYSTKKEHLPESHLAVKEALPQTLIDSAKDIGPHTTAIISGLINGARHPLMFLRRAQGVLRLENRYSRQALERACEKISGIGSELPRLSDIEAIIKTNLDSKSANVYAIRRNSNEFLRGQSSWAQAPNPKEEKN